MKEGGREGRRDVPIKYFTLSATPRPSLKAHTTRDWPLLRSPSATTNKHTHMGMKQGRREGRTNQILIHAVRHASAFIEGSHHQRLAPPAVTHSNNEQAHTHRRDGGRDVPIKYLFTLSATPRPSLMAHTTKDWPLLQSPAAKTPSTLVL